MSERLKQILKTLGFIVLILVIGWALWVVFFKSPDQPLIPGITEETPFFGGLPGIGEGPGGQVVEEGGLPAFLIPEPGAESRPPDSVAAGSRTAVQSISDSHVEFPTLTQAGFRYYSPTTQRFYRLSENGGEPVALTDEVFRNVEAVTWSQSGSRAVIEFPDGSNIFYDFNTQERATLPQRGQEFTFAPGEREVAYEYVGASEDDRWIVASNTDGTGQRLIQPIGDQVNNVAVSWSPNEQVIATYRKVSPSGGEEIFFIGFNGENNFSLLTNGLGFKGVWSPEGKQILYSVYSENTNFNPSLHIAGAQGDAIGVANRSLRLQTWPDKCVFRDEATVYCAVPRQLETGSGLFPELAAGAPDVLFKIDLINNLSSVLAFPETANRSSFSVENLMLSRDGSMLYFTERSTGEIYQLRLR